MGTTSGNSGVGAVPTQNAIIMGVSQSDAYVGPFGVLPNGVLRLENDEVDLTTVEGVHKIQGILSPERLAELYAAMKENGFAMTEGRFVPKDAAKVAVSEDDAYKQQLLFEAGVGPAPEGVTADDLYTDMLVPASNAPPTKTLTRPTSTTSTESVYDQQVKASPEFKRALAAYEAFKANPNAPAAPEYRPSPLAPPTVEPYKFEPTTQSSLLPWEAGLAKFPAYKTNADVFQERLDELQRAFPDADAASLFLPKEEVDKKLAGVLAESDPSLLLVRDTGLYDQVKDSAEFRDAKNALKIVLDDPTVLNQSEFFTRLNGLKARYPHGDVQELLIIVMRESVQDRNEDKKYVLKKLQDDNKKAQRLSDYLKELTDASFQLSEMSRREGNEHPEADVVQVPVRVFDLSTLNSDGELVETKIEYKWVSRTDLDKMMKDIEANQETIRNQRQMDVTAFQNIDQKTNQDFNILATMLKSKGEMLFGTTRNIQ